MTSGTMRPGIRGSTGGSSEVQPGEKRPVDLTVALLGDFTVRHRGEPVEIAAGLPAQAVRFVAVHGGRVRTDRLSAALWPGASSAEQRKGVRNVLSRLGSAGVSILEREDDNLRLPRSSRVDAMVFRTIADRVLVNASRRGATDGARLALDHYRGDLLPDDDAEWLVRPREALRRRRAVLLDLLAKEARGRGAVHEAVSLLELAIETEPHDEVRRLEVADLLIGAGRRGRAAVHIAQSRDVLEQVGLTPGADWETMRARLHGEEVSPT